ncbi:Cytochrome b-c1 complex subunit 8, mitochondrial [Nakaseomyces bracarensis]|uniref:Cytochrome b-c1 complex subunit 8 n=1 Tax=Nakaseomyces bracarensis TaxID=273131 RepID=A0ABR4NQQ2_9SACH
MSPPGAKAYMGWWGHLGSPKQKGITSYSVSPYAQKPLAHSMQNAVFNTFRRVKSQALYVLIPAGIYYYWWVNSRDYNEYLYTKAGREELERVNN